MLQVLQHIFRENKNNEYDGRYRYRYNITGGNNTVTMITSGHSLSSVNIYYSNKTLSAAPMVVTANVPGTYDNSVIMFYVENGALNDGGGSAIPFAMFTDSFNFTFTDYVFIQVTEWYYSNNVVCYIMK
jgi:hypothetical protein